jgi:hypothetical protein
MEIGQYLFYVDRYSDAVNKAVAHGTLHTPLLPKELLDLEGMSSWSIRIMLNSLFSQLPHSTYLEIGSWKGSTFISALYKNQTVNATSIDFQQEYINNPALISTPEVLKNNCARFLTNGEKYELIVDDCFKYKPPTDKKYNVYLFDGPHTYLEQYNAIKHYYDNLDSVFVYICDDYNTPGVEKGTQDALRELDIEVITEHKMYGCQSFPGHTTTGWWNGYYIAVCAKRKELPQFFKTRWDGYKWAAHRFAEQPFTMEIKPL